jgi:flagellar basal body-associated protein FliL
MEMKRQGFSMRSASLAILLAAAVIAALPARADDDTKKPEHKITQSKSFIMVEPFYTTIYDAGRPSGMLMVAIGLDIPDAMLRADADRSMPLLRDYYLRSLSSFATNSVRPWAQPNVTAIGARLQRVTDRALHRPGAKVLLAEVAMRLSR